MYYDTRLIEVYKNIEICSNKDFGYYFFYDDTKNHARRVFDTVGNLKKCIDEEGR